jgi:hypothetical protein
MVFAKFRAVIGHCSFYSFGVGMRATQLQCRVIPDDLFNPLVTIVIPVGFTFGIV